MKFIKNEPFIGVTKKPVKIREESKEDAVEATVGSMLKLVLTSYTPNPQERQVLSVADIRKYNRVMDILDGSPNATEDKDYYRFEDEDFSVAQRVVDWMSPLLIISISRNMPQLVDILSKAKNENDFKAKEEKKDKEESDGTKAS